MNLVFNELALQNMPADNKKAAEIMSNFVTCYSRIVNRDSRFSRDILSSKNLNEINLNDCLPVAKWRNNVDKDIANAFRGLCQRQIFLVMPDDEAELECEQGKGEGLLCAYINGDIAISLESDSFWKSFLIGATFIDKADCSKEAVQVANITNEHQISENFDYIQSRFRYAAQKIQTPKDLLSNLNQQFPGLILHNKAIDQLKTQVQPQHVSAIINKLCELNEYFCAWTEGSFDPNGFKTKISPQSQSALEKRRKEHTFSFEGNDILVSYHLRYTGNIAGRIYFHPLLESKKGLVCSLTTKL